MKKPLLAILGGTFDPIHLGHISLLKTIYKKLKTSKILLIPCKQSPLKTAPIAPTQDRLKMAKIATLKLRYVKIDPYETKNKTLSYTSKTLAYLKKKYRNYQLILIMGSDAFGQFDKWHKWQKILTLSHLVVVNRTNSPPNFKKPIKKLLLAHQTINPNELKQKTSGLIFELKIKPLPISATKIRQLAKLDKNVTRLVPSKVAKYIDDNKLYNY